ncbi:DUF2339 domain-containing protein [Acinetobacter chinensis]|uniref:DUF2339 domain-containing protein n=1 Tax=Acinetobacter chinensis TaxID=2004650 RepID=A0ABU3WIY6_9GAMM|nr:DUF2339 domain-containing protein [Acinetobacter chinensis]MDV2470349.1 DUF2339 domain-containing protein [Acinetobacter chinensis]
MLNGSLKGQNEIRMIWLMVLIIVAVSAWFLKTPVVTYICVVALMISVMQYVDAVRKPLDELSVQYQHTSEPTSKMPLYIASVLAFAGGFMDLQWLTALGVTAWIFFFLRWLQRLELALNRLQFQIGNRKTADHIAEPFQSVAEEQRQSHNAETELSLSGQIRQWIFTGNPVLKVAISVLIAGLILLLRFATEHWQLSLALKLVIVAGFSAAIAGGGYTLFSRNRSFALALEGLGIAGLFLTLFFAYYNSVIASLLSASLCFAVIMAVTVWLSLKQQSVELSLMAMLVAYAAPFTLPVRDATAPELLSYYLVINLTVALLSTLRPWKYLNQIALLMTAVVGGGYAFAHAKLIERPVLSLLILAHAAVFIWIGFRFSQLLAKHDFNSFKLKPVLDLAVIYGTPLTAYFSLYLMYFELPYQQAVFSLLFAGVYLLLYLWCRNRQIIELIAQSYFSLMLIFLALILPILLPEQWSVVGWAVEGAVVFIFALYRKSMLSQYLAMGLLSVAGLNGLYSLVNSDSFPFIMGWGLSLSYLSVVLMANRTASFRQQLNTFSVIFFGMLMFSAMIMLLAVLLDLLHGSDQLLHALLICSGLLLMINEYLKYCKAGWTWRVPEWAGLLPLSAVVAWLLMRNMHDGMLVWSDLYIRTGFAVAATVLTLIWLRPLSGLKMAKEWVSLGALSSLSAVSLTLFPGIPFISVVILPLLFAVWCFKQPSDSTWRLCWQSRSSLCLLMLWMICSQLYSQQAFHAYFVPVLNPFDVVSIMVLIGFIWMLTLQIHSGLDRSLAAVLVVLGVLWLSSYVLLRALHIYAATPYNDISLWKNGLVQLSLTLLWVGLAFVAMSTASRKQLKPVWLLGGSLLVIVTLKLVLFDLSHIGTLTRVISFLGAGFVMLVIAYIAPMPGQKNESV